MLSRIRLHWQQLEILQRALSGKLTEHVMSITLSCSRRLPALTLTMLNLWASPKFVLQFSISSYAWSDGYAGGCEKWLHFIANCMKHQVDFISGDGNQFAQRNFKKEEHSHYRTCIMIDILERFLLHMNLHRSALNRISYNVVSSTQAGQYIRSMKGHAADCDSMLLISLCYGKQTLISEDRGRQESASTDGSAGPAYKYEDEIIFTDVEQAKHLLTYDLLGSPHDHFFIYLTEYCRIWRNDNFFFGSFAHIWQYVATSGMFEEYR
jgi:hypothetical protein